MERYVKIFLAIGCLLLLVGTANAQHLLTAGICYDVRYYQQLYNARGGAEGQSGAYIQIHAGVVGYNELSDIRITATHETGFIVSVREDPPSCVGVSPWDEDQSFSVRLAAEGWMTGEWEITLEYRGPRGQRTETMTLNVPRFNFPPVPTGIEVLYYQGTKYVVWNRIGDPGSGPGKHVEYVIMHFTSPSPPRCINDWLVIKSSTDNYELWSGNRIAVPISEKGWNSGELIRIENRVYDDNNGGPYRWDRGCKYVILP